MSLNVNKIQHINVSYISKCKNHFFRISSLPYTSSFHLERVQGILNRIRIDRFVSIPHFFAKKRQNKSKKEIRKERTQFYSSSGTNSSLNTHRQPGDRKTVYQSLDNWSLSLVPAEVELLSVLRWSAPAWAWVIVQQSVHVLHGGRPAQSVCSTDEKREVEALNSPRPHSLKKSFVSFVERSTCDTLARFTLIPLSFFFYSTSLSLSTSITAI